MSKRHVYEKGQQVVHCTGGRASLVPDGTHGTILGPAPATFGHDVWEVEWHGQPHPVTTLDKRSRFTVRSPTSWFTRGEMIRPFKPEPVEDVDG